MNQRLSKNHKRSLISLLLLATISAQAASTVDTTDKSTTLPIATQPASAQPDSNLALSVDNTLAAQMQPSNQALSDANQELLGRNAKLQRQVNDLQTQVNVLVYESKGQLFLYGAFTAVSYTHLTLPTICSV